MKKWAQSLPSKTSLAKLGGYEVTTIRAIIELVLWVFILRAIAEFIPPLENSVVGKGVRYISEPVLAPLRRIIRPVVFGEMEIDLSAVVLVLILYGLQTLI